MRSKTWRVLAIIAAAPLALAACADGDDSGAAGDVSCPIDALRDTDAPVEITFWHAQQAENEVVLEDLIDQFEAQEPRVQVNLVNQVAYPELFEQYTAAVGGSGEVPALVQMEDITIQRLVDSQSTVPVQSCVEADDYDLSDFLPPALDFYSTGDVLRAMPWNVSNVVLIYNRNMFETAGLDPDDPPQTLDEVRAYSQQIVDSGAAPNGLALHVEPYVIETLYAKTGAELVNNGNGRDGRATEARLDSDHGGEIWTWWDEMVDSGLALNTGAQPENYDHLFALGNRQAAMTFEASAVLGSVEAVLASGEFGGFEVGVGPLPSLEPGGGVPVSDGSLWLPEGASDEETAAAWALMKFLTEAGPQATLSVGSQGGYVPVRMSTLDDPALQQLWTQKPWLRVPYDQVEAGPNNAATAGAVIGDYQGVRDAMREGFIRMLVEGVAPDDALADAEAQANEVIQAYNERVRA